MTIRGGPYSGEREEGHAAGCARVDRERAAMRPTGPRASDRRRAPPTIEGRGRVRLARLPYREPAPELAAAVDRFLAVRDLMPTSRRSYRQVLTAVTAATGPSATTRGHRPGLVGNHPEDANAARDGKRAGGSSRPAGTARHPPARM